MKMKKKMIKIIASLSLVLLLGACSESTPKNQTVTESSAQVKEKSDAVTLYVTRHGKTIFNTMHRVQGWSDTPLTEPGVEVAEFLGKGIQDVAFDAVYSSDSGRARETAEIILASKGQSDLTLNESPNLREMHFGKYEGDFDENMWGPAAKSLGYESQEKLMADLGKVGLEKVTQAMADNDETGEFETFGEVRQRMQKELKQIAEEVGKKGGKNVLIVSHGMAISSLLSDLTDEDVNKQLPNASISKLVVKEGEFTVESVGDVSYIEAGEKLSK